MFGTPPNAPQSNEKVYESLVNEYFRSLKGLCRDEGSLDKDSRERVKEAGIQLLSFIMKGIDANLEDEEKKNKIYLKMKKRFMLVLVENDFKWVWELFKEFTSKLPKDFEN